MPVDTGKRTLRHESPQLSAGVVGAGQVGSALWKVLAPVFDVVPLDPAQGYTLDRPYLDHLHFCVPYDEEFRTTVAFWVKQTEPQAVILHSTVPPGTTRIVSGDLTTMKLDPYLAYSPVLGYHPHLYDHLRSFLKPVAGLTPEATQVVAGIMTEASVQCAIFDTPEEVEWAHALFSVRQGLDYAWAVAVDSLCRHDGLAFDQVHLGWTQLMNLGHTKIGQDGLCFPMSRPGTPLAYEGVPSIAETIWGTRYMVPELEELRCLIRHIVTATIDSTHQIPPGIAEDNV